MKNFILLLMFQLTVIAVGQPLKQVIDIDATSKNIAQRRVHRYTRALKTDPTTCSLDQYFDTDEGRCLDVTGGGRVLYINNTNSCGADVLQPHCTNTRYYYICKNSKTILAQCIQGQRYENRLQKCVAVNSDDLVSSTVQPNPETDESIQLPECKKPGSFPVPDDCALFYTCETNGDQMFQSIFVCPKDMGYNRKKKMCSFSCGCENINSDEAFCAPTIVNERNVEESTNTESSVRITDPDKDNEAVEDTTLANIDDEPVSTVSYQDSTPTEFTEFTVHVDVITERASNNLRCSDSETSTAYSTTNEKELLPDEEVNRFTETTTFMSTVLNEDRTPETETPGETTLAETDAGTLMVDVTTPNDRKIQSTENGMIVTEETAEELIPKVTTDAVDSKTTLADLSTPSSGEIQNSEIKKNESLEDSTSNDPILNDEYDTTESSDDANVEPTTNDPILKSSPLKDFKSNKKCDTTETEPSSEEISKETGVEKNFPKNIPTETEGTDSEPMSSLNDSSTTKLSASTESTFNSETTVNPTQESDEGTTDGIEEPVESSTAMIIKEPSTGLTTSNENDNNNMSSTPGSSNGNAEPTFSNNIDTNNENAVTNKNINPDADNKSVVQDEPLMNKTSKANNVQEPSADFNEENVSDISPTSNPESLNKHSLVSGKRNATSKESMNALKTIQSTMKVSPDIILPIMSAILIIVDVLERFFVQVFSKIQG